VAPDGIDDVRMSDLREAAANTGGLCILVLLVLVPLVINRPVYRLRKAYLGSPLPPSPSGVASLFLSLIGGAVVFYTLMIAFDALL